MSRTAAETFNRELLKKTRDEFIQVYHKYKNVRTESERPNAAPLQACMLLEEVVMPLCFSGAELKPETNPPTYEEISKIIQTINYVLETFDSKTYTKYLQTMLEQANIMARITNPARDKQLLCSPRYAGLLGNSGKHLTQMRLADDDAKAAQKKDNSSSPEFGVSFGVQGW